MAVANAPQEPDDRQEAEVNEPLELHSYLSGGEYQYMLHDPVTHRSVRLNEDPMDAFVDVGEMR